VQENITKKTDTGGMIPQPATTAPQRKKQTQKQKQKQAGTIKRVNTDAHKTASTEPTVATDTQDTAAVVAAVVVAAIVAKPTNTTNTTSTTTKKKGNKTAGKRKRRQLSEEEEIAFRRNRNKRHAQKSRAKKLALLNGAHVRAEKAFEALQRMLHVNEEVWNGLEQEYGNEWREFALNELGWQRDGDWLALSGEMQPELDCATV
jgi:hypothetical protein